MSMRMVSWKRLYFANSGKSAFIFYTVVSSVTKKDQKKEHEQQSTTGPRRFCSPGCTCSIVWTAWTSRLFQQWESRLLFSNHFRYWVHTTVLPARLDTDNANCQYWLLSGQSIASLWTCEFQQIRSRMLPEKPRQWSKLSTKFLHRQARFGEMLCSHQNLLSRYAR